MYVCPKGWKHTFSYHYSLEYWTVCYSVMHSYSKILDAGPHGLSKEQMHDEFPGAAEKAEVEEQVDNSGWHAWGRYTDFLGFKVWTDMSVWVAYIRHTDQATKIMPIFEGTPSVVKEKWDEILAAAKGYPWAEQAGPDEQFNGVFVNWPRSLYEERQTNSNTFVEYVLRSAGLPLVEMSGWHPGYDEPKQNVAYLEWWAGPPLYLPGGTPVQFFATEPPWKTTKPRREPPQ
jgi:hypothetical protein